MNKPSVWKSWLHVARGVLLLTLVILAMGAWHGSAAASPPGPDQTLAGWFNIIWGDAPDGQTQTLYTLTLPDGETTTLTFADPALASMETLLAWRGRFLQVEGAWMETDQEAPGFYVAQMDAGVDAQAAAPELAGAQPWISIMCKFSDVGAEPRAPSYFQNMYSGAFPGLDHYWREQSYNQINVVGSGAASQWYTLPQPRSYYVYDSNGDGIPDFNFSRASKDCTALADPYVYFPGYLGINMMFNSDLDGYAWGGGYFLNLDGVSKAWYTTWEPEWAYSNVTVVAHEMGHGFGLPHSSGMYGRTYDNRWDVMSDTWTDCANLRDAVYGCLGQHTNAYHKYLEGWIGARRYVVPTGATITLALEQLAQPQTSYTLMVQIPIGGATGRFYTVEARRRVGYDVKLPGQGVIIHQVDTSRSIPSQIVDVDGNGNTGDAGALWTAGETFVDAANHITVAINGVTTTGFVIMVSNAANPVNPTATPTPQPTWTPTAMATATFTPQPTWTPTAMATATFTPQPTATPTRLATATPTRRPTATPTKAVHVGDLDRSPVRSGSKWTARVTIGIHDATHKAVVGATISGAWSNGTSGTSTCVTVTSGRCTVSKTGLVASTGSVRFNVKTVAAPGYVYAPARNHDPDGESTGTSIVVSKP